MTQNDRIEPTLSTGPQPATAGGSQAAPEATQATSPEAEALQKAQAEAADLKDRLLRQAADTENLRKRMEREKEDAVKFGASKFAKDILSVGDNLRRALENMPKDAAMAEPVQNLVAGIEATERELLSVFERHGIARIDPKGQRFDPNLHQAMFELEDPSVPAGTVLQVVAAGYVQHGRLLRAAMVGVSKGGPQPDAQAGQTINTQA